MGKAGRPTISFRSFSGSEIKGLSKGKDGRWRVAANGQKFTQENESVAIAKFYSIMAKINPQQDGIFVSIPQEKTEAQSKLENQHPEIAADLNAAFGKRETRIGLDVPEDILYAWLRNELLNNSVELSKRVGIPQLASIDSWGIPKASIPLDDIIAIYQKHNTANPKHKMEVNNQWQDFMRLTSATTLSDLSIDSLKVYRKSIIGKVSAYTCRQYFNRIKSVIRFGKSKDIDPVQLDNVLSKMAILKAPKDNRKYTPHPISVENWKSILKVAHNDYPNWEVMLLITLNLCLHFGETLSLKWEHFDIENGTYCGHREKQGKCIRAAVLWDETKEALKSIKRTNGPYIFVSRMGLPLKNSSGLKRTFTSITKTAGCPNVMLDDFRDGAYTAACQTPNVQEKYARVLAGHKSPGIQDAYVQANPSIVATACLAVYQTYFS